MTKRINLHLVSDSTGETLSAVSSAVTSQFDEVEAKDFIWPLIRTQGQIDKVIESVKQNPGIILYSVLEEDLTKKLNKICFDLQIPCISVLAPIISEFSNYLGQNISNAVGRQHILDKDYFSKVDAINYTIAHDDGQLADRLHDADIVLIGVSRTSKSPTSVYLSCRGYKTANIPFVDINLMPQNLSELKKPLIVGLTINPSKLIEIRTSRMQSLGQEGKTDYIDLDKVENEIKESRKLFAKLKCPIIDVTKSSVEETAVKIIKLYQEKHV